MFKLVHISDIHLAPLPKPTLRQLMNKRITGYINWKKNRKSSHEPDELGKIITHLKSQSPDHIIVTGDVTNLSLPQEFANSLDFFHSLGQPEQVSTLCGNHDAYVPGAINKAIEVWQPWLSSDDKMTLHVDDFPYLRIRGDVAIIGCNSAEATLPFMATGYFREKQAIKLSSILEHTKDLCRVVMIHHPPFHGATPKYKRLIGIDLFQDTVRAHGAELILHGHTHLATRTHIKSDHGDIPVICVPAAGQSIGGHKPPAQYNLFKISRNHNNWHIELDAYGLDKTGKMITKL